MQSFRADSCGEVKSSVDRGETKAEEHNRIGCCLGDRGRCNHFWKVQVAHMVESANSPVKGRCSRHMQREV